MAERCSGSDILCDTDADRQVCPGCGFVTDTIEECWLDQGPGRRVYRRRFDTHWVLTEADAALVDFIDQVRAG